MKFEKGQPGFHTKRHPLLLHSFHQLFSSELHHGAVAAEVKARTPAIISGLKNTNRSKNTGYTVICMSRIVKIRLLGYNLVFGKYKEHT